jgi:hypothetical protein
VTGTSGVPAAGAGCRCVMFSRVRAVDFVSHNMSSQVRCASLRSRLALESLNIRPASVEWKRCLAIRDALCDAVAAVIANVSSESAEV